MGTTKSQGEFHVKTFVFLDLETCGDLPPRLPFCYDAPGNADKLRFTLMNGRVSPGKMAPRITELALAAVSAESLVRRSVDGGAPRDIDVFSKVVDPCAPESSVNRVAGITGLKPHMLKGRSRLEEIWPAVVEFLNTLQPPICFVAHNGISFDFRVLAYELERLGLSMPSDNQIYFIDSWFALKQIDINLWSKTKANLRGILADKLVNNSFSGSASPSRCVNIVSIPPVPAVISFSSVVNNICSQEAEAPPDPRVDNWSTASLMKTPEKCLRVNEECLTNAPKKLKLEEIEEMKYEIHEPRMKRRLDFDDVTSTSGDGVKRTRVDAETTATLATAMSDNQLTASPLTPPGRSAGRSDQDEIEAIWQQLNHDHWPLAMRKLIRKESLRPRKTHNVTETPPNGTRFEIQQTNRQTYKQTSIYQDIFGCQPRDAHRALGDCYALLAICGAYGQEWLSYANSSAQPLRLHVG